MGRETHERRVERIAREAIVNSLQAIEDAMVIKYGSPLDALTTELRLYAKHLRTWTCDTEEFGAVRPLRDLLADAALTISLQASGPEQCQ